MVLPQIPLIHCHSACWLEQQTTATAVTPLWLWTPSWHYQHALGRGGETGTKIV